MSETIWQPSLLHPGRVHVSGAPGHALCGAELDPTPVRCALCALTTAGIEPYAAADVRDQLEKDSVDCAEPEPELLLALRETDLDTEADAQYAATRAALAVERTIVAAYADAERILATLDIAPPSARAHRARAPHRHPRHTERESHLSRSRRPCPPRRVRTPGRSPSVSAQCPRRSAGSQENRSRNTAAGG